MERRCHGYNQGKNIEMHEEETSLLLEKKIMGLVNLSSEIKDFSMGA
jgi:hypothetical protein